MNTDETVRTDAVISVTTTKLVIPFLEIVADALTVIKMQNAMKVRYKMYHLKDTKIKKKKLRKEFIDKTKTHLLEFLCECCCFHQI